MYNVQQCYRDIVAKTESQPHKLFISFLALFRSLRLRKNRTKSL